MVNPQARTANIQRYNLTGFVYVPPDDDVNNSTGRYERIFSSSDLSVNGDLVITHNLLNYPSSVRVLDENLEEINPGLIQDVRSNPVTALIINMTAFVPFDNYRLIIKV